MSKSYKKLPITGHTMAQSDRWYKRYLHSRRRSRLRQLICNKQYDELDTDIPFDDWDSDKDGKVYIKDVEYNDRIFRK